MSKTNNNPCRNCKEAVDECACIRNKCLTCGEPVGNITFTCCDDCWDIKFPKKKVATPESLGKEMTDCDGHLLCECDSCTAVWASRNKRVKDAEFAQQQTDKLYTKEQIIEAYESGRTNAFDSNYDQSEVLPMSGEEWFNNTYENPEAEKGNKE